MLEQGGGSGGETGLVEGQVLGQAGFRVLDSSTTCPTTTACLTVVMAEG